MKYVKMLGLAAVAAMALMAFLGAGSASATVLCKTQLTSGCAGPWDATSIEASLTGTARLETTGGTLLDTCTSGKVKGTTTSTGGASETVGGPIEELTWGSTETACTKTTDTVTKGTLEIHSIAGTDNGTVTASGAEVTVNTIFGTCTYGTGTGKDLGTLKGGAPATLEISTNVIKLGGGGTCPAETKWVANYSVTSPNPLYVSAS